jgi:cell division transport system permease protein
MKPVSIKYILVESFNNILRNKVLFITSIFTVCVTILLMGVVGILLMNVSYNSDEMLDEMLHITVYVIPEADEKTLNEIQDVIVNDPHVESSTYVSKLEAYEASKELVGEEVMEELGYDFLPPSFIVKLNDVTYANIFVHKMSSMSNIYEVKYSSESYERAGRISYTIRYVCGALTGLLGILSLFLISNTIKITVSSSKEEVTIMRYIGASEARIKVPFFLQGGFIGFLGAIISFIIAGFGYNYIYTKLEGSLSDYIGVLELVPIPQMLLVLLGVFMLYGIVLGVLGSFFAIRKYLKA